MNATTHYRVRKNSTRQKELNMYATTHEPTHRTPCQFDAIRVRCNILARTGRPRHDLNHGTRVSCLPVMLSCDALLSLAGGQASAKQMEMENFHPQRQRLFCETPQDTMPRRSHHRVPKKKINHARGHQGYPSSAKSKRTRALRRWKKKIKHANQMEMENFHPQRLFCETPQGTMPR